MGRCSSVRCRSQNLSVLSFIEEVVTNTSNPLMALPLKIILF